MADRKVNFLTTLVFDENSDIRKQVDTELVFKNRLTEDLQHLIVGREIKHFIVADDEMINKKLTEERKVGKWEKNEHTFWTCSECGLVNKYNRIRYAYCPNCGADMRGNTKRKGEPIEGNNESYNYENWIP